MTPKNAIIETERALTAAVYATRKAKTDPRNRTAHIKPRSNMSEKRRATANRKGLRHAKF